VPGSAPAPTVHNSPAPAGQVHPDRMMPKDPWMAGGNKPFEGGQNPNAFNEGYTPGNGMMGDGESPDIMKQFIQGGGQNEDGSDGFGGSFGAVTRFGSLMDTRAIGTLTQGQNRLPSEGGEYRDDLIGGNPKALDPSIMGGFANAPPPQPPTSVPASNQPPANPFGVLPQKLQPVAPNGGVAAGQAQGTTSQLQNPNHFRDEFRKNMKLGPGNADFDAIKKAMGPQATDDMVTDAIYGSARRQAALTKAGYTPGSPKFAEAKLALQKQLMAKVPNIDGTMAEMDAEIKRMTAANPNDPEIAAMQKELKALQVIKSGQFDDDDVFDFLQETNAVDPNSISEYEMLQQMRGDNSNLQRTVRTLVSPVTGPAAFKAMSSGWSALRGKPAEKAVEKAVEKSPTFMGKFLGKSKYLAKKVPVLGWGLEAYDAFNTPADELRAKFDHEMNRPLTAGNVGNYLLDKALNPGQNLRASGIVLNDAAAGVNDSAKRVQMTIAQGVGVMQAQVRKFEELAKIRPLTAEEQSEMKQYQERIGTQQQVIRDNVGGRPLTELGQNLTDTKSFTDPRRWDFLLGRESYKRKNQLDADRRADKAYMDTLQKNYGAKLDLGKSMIGKPTTDPAHADAVNEYVNSITGWNFGESYGHMFGPATPERIAEDEKYAQQAVAELLAARQAIGTTNPDLAARLDGKLDQLGRTPEDRAKKRDEFMKTEDPLRKGFDRSGKPMPPKPIDVTKYLDPKTRIPFPGDPPKWGKTEDGQPYYFDGKTMHLGVQEGRYPGDWDANKPLQPFGGFGTTPTPGTNLLPGLYGTPSATPGGFGSFGATPGGSLPGLGGFQLPRGGKEEVPSNW
jgi:hypothetical protein